MENEYILDKIIEKEQFTLNQTEKEDILLEILKEQLYRNLQNDNLKSLYDKLNFQISNLSDIKDIPFIPVNMFKKFDLRTCNEEDVVKILNSSATTTGIPSKIYIDKITAFRQSKALISILRNFLGSNRRPMLVIDSKDINMKSSTMTARGAAVRGISNFANKIVYAMESNGDDLTLNINTLKEFEEKYSNQEVLIYGFTYIIWTKLAKILQENNIKLNLPNVKILHSGGWKKLNNQKVSKEIFSSNLAELLNTKQENIIDFYGMVEQLGVVFVDCPYGHKHVPNFADVIIRDLITSDEVQIGQAGLIEVISALATSYPSQAILTEDIGEFIGIDDCPCGRKGKYFKFKSRVEKAEIRGCGDTFAEKERKI